MSVSRLCARLIEALIVFLLVFMVVIVFPNVVMRYGLNSGIHLSDELSRYAFVWLTILGAIVTALPLNDNLGMALTTAASLIPVPAPEGGGTIGDDRHRLAVRRGSRL